VATAEHGRDGAISGSVTLPEGKAFQLTLHLMAGDRELDVRNARVDVVAPASFATRMHELLLDNALFIIIGVVALLVVGAAFAVAYIARLKARLRTA
jgi:hypothetical protein